MPTVLITAFEPYDRWPDNASWLTLIALTRDLPTDLKIVTRLYPVDFELARARLVADLAQDFDFALHLGQAPGISRIHLEAFGVNIGGHSTQTPDQFQPLVPGGPPAYQSALPLGAWAAKIRELGIPCQVSYHAGTYLCNAMLYLTHHLACERRLQTRAAFIHLPLAPEQVLTERQDWPSLPSGQCAEALRLLLRELPMLRAAGSPDPLPIR
jgi:pyroglutamyl-peptidase